jgi:N6-adenosine-specific RNA methylase IME4
LQLRKKKILEKKAKANLVTSTGGKNPQPLPNLAKPALHTREELAKAAKVSNGNMQKIELISKHADEDTKAKLRRGDTTIHRVANDIKRIEKREEHAKKVALAKSSPPKVTETPGIVLADPPWRYEHCEAVTREIENQYSTAPLAEIFLHSPKTLGDCILFLWATAPKLDESLQVMKAWGFSYRSCAVWDKEVIGMGYWWRIQHELLLVGIKGNPGCTPESERISSMFKSPRGKHSQKPECIFEWIERAFPLIPKHEMYQRIPRKGWSGSGNEV